MSSILSHQFEPQTAEGRDRKIKRIHVRQRVNESSGSGYKSVDHSGLVPQSDMNVTEQLVQDENEGKEIKMQEITVFNDSHVDHDAPIVDEHSWANNTMPDVDLMRFLRRPIEVGEVVWASSSAIGASLGSWSFPQVYFNTTIANKIEKIAFWRPNFEISIRMNGTPMHYGTLVFAWLPQAGNLDPAYFSDYRSIFGNNWLQVSASANQTTTFTVPYTHYKDMLSVGALQVDLFYLYCFVSVPLNSVNGAPPPVNFTIYARVLEPNLAGYTYTSNFTSQSDTQGVIAPKFQRQKLVDTEAEKKTDTGRIVSTTLKSVSDFSSHFKSIPFIGELAAPVSTLFGGLSGVAHWLGFDIPVNESYTHPIQVRQPRMITVEDNPAAVTLGIRPSMSLSKDYAMVNDTIEASSILRFIQRPCIYYTGTIVSTNAAGTNLFVDPVTPFAFGVSDYTQATVPALFYLTPLSWMAKNFQFWRGGLRVHLHFVCSHFHSTRVRIWYLPYVANTVWAQFEDIAPTETNTQDVVNVVLDITQETDYSFTIPYMQQSEFLEVVNQLNPVGNTPSTGYDIMTQCNGIWGIQLINALTSGAATVSPIYYQVFYSAANDFQFAVPTAQNLQSQGIFIPQSDFDCVYEPQADFKVLKCEIPSSSMRCLFEKDYPPIGGVACGRATHDVYMTSEVRSIKQMTNLLSPALSTALTLATGCSFTINPTGLLNPYLVSPKMFSLNYLYTMMSVFRYARGGFRASVRSKDPSMLVNSITVTQHYNGTANFVTTSAVSRDINDLTSGPNLDYTANAQWTRCENSPADMICPQNLYYRCYPILNSATAPSAQDAIPNQVFTMYCNTQLTTTPVCLFVSGADDFILGFQLGIPAQTTTVA